MSHPAVLLDASEFFWAVLGDVPRRRFLQPASHYEAQLGYAFEEVLPLPIEQVHAVYEPLADGKVLACGMARENVSRLATPNTLTLSPSQLPPFILEALADTRIEPSRINLLTGTYSPAQVRRARTQTRALIAAAIALCTLLALLGVQRRVNWHEARRHAAYETASNLYTQVLTPASRASEQPAARMLSELRSLRQTRADAPPAASRDVTDTFHRLLAAWPSSLHARGESLVITGSSTALTVTVSTHADAEAIIAALQGVRGWKSDQPQVTSQRDAVRLSMRFTPEAGVQTPLASDAGVDGPRGAAATPSGSKEAVR